MNVYYYYKLSKDSYKKYIQEIPATTTKKLVSSIFILNSWKPMFISTIETHISNIYKKFMQLP